MQSITEIFRVFFYNFGKFKDVKIFKEFHSIIRSLATTVVTVRYRPLYTRFFICFTYHITISEQVTQKFSIESIPLSLTNIKLLTSNKTYLFMHQTQVEIHKMMKKKSLRIITGGANMIFFRFCLQVIVLEIFKGDNFKGPWSTNVFFFVFILSSRKSNKFFIFSL